MNKPDPHHQTTPAPNAAVAPARISTQSLLQGRTVIEIEHAGERYQLRITRGNKLILTK